jgi:hypothetical protein
MEQGLTGGILEIASAPARAAADSPRRSVDCEINGSRLPVAAIDVRALLIRKATMSACCMAAMPSAVLLSLSPARCPAASRRRRRCHIAGRGRKWMGVRETGYRPACSLRSILLMMLT